MRRRLYRRRFDLPKSRYSLRSVPLAPGIAQQFWCLRGSASDEAPVFPSQIGTHLDQSKVFSRVLKPAARKAGYPGPASTRFHTCATLLFRHGFNAKQVQMWLGHHS